MEVDSAALAFTAQLQVHHLLHNAGWDRDSLPEDHVQINIHQEQPVFSTEGCGLPCSAFGDPCLASGAYGLTRASGGAAPSLSMSAAPTGAAFVHTRVRQMSL
jgi:hypothetical protein